jgi:glycosyltransferase involved in cell wall biosynthesis
MIIDLRLRDRVEICGALPHEEVIERYRRASLFVLPCVQSTDGNRDGIPNVLLEAMAMQIPVISTRVSAIPELITDGANGVLVEPGDPLALAKAMEALLQSPKRADRLAENGRKTVASNYDLEANVRRFANTFWPDWIE